MKKKKKCPMALESYDNLVVKRHTYVLDTAYENKEKGVGWCLPILTFRPSSHLMFG